MRVVGIVQTKDGKSAARIEKAPPRLRRGGASHIRCNLHRRNDAAVDNGRIEDEG
jgi:hypothetical protein